MDISVGQPAEYLRNGTTVEPGKVDAKPMSTWQVLGTGGDLRLQIDPDTLLNGYGCSPRPRPWAITFASSTASSVSERGYMAAEAALLRMREASGGDQGSREAVQTCFHDVRAMLAQLLRLDPETGIVLAAFGTDVELLALAICHLGGDKAARICNILIEPHETGRGVPMAAQGNHFAVNTARGDEVTPSTLIEGFRPDTWLCDIPLRDGNSKLRLVEAVEAEIGMPCEIL